MPRANQYAPNPPLGLIEQIIRKGFENGLNDKQILEQVRDFILPLGYGLEIKKFRKMREELGCYRSRSSGYDASNIGDAMQKLRPVYPNAGYRDVVSLLATEQNIVVARSQVQQWCHINEQDLVDQRRKRVLVRRQYISPGLFDTICVDQHDKWKYTLNLALHTGVEPFSGKILWMNVWHNNNNPRLILSYYLDWVEEFGYMPLVTQSDPGTENFGIANGHTALRHLHDENMRDALCHRWMRVKKNIKPEIAWSQFRRRFAPGFEMLMQKGLDADWYSPANPIENLLFRWVFIPWLQLELDAYVERINKFRKRNNKNKLLPQGVPDLIASEPERFGAMDFKIKVNPEHLKQVREQLITNDPATTAVLQLVPPDFHELATAVYRQLGEPVINRETVWDVYLALLEPIQGGSARSTPEQHSSWAKAASLPSPGQDDPGNEGCDLVLFPGLQPSEEKEEGEDREHRAPGDHPSQSDREMEELSPASLARILQDGVPFTEREDDDNEEDDVERRGNGDWQQMPMVNLRRLDFEH